MLFPTTAWFVAHWVRYAHHLVSVDISTPLTRSGFDWWFDDLELDPFALHDGTFGVEDVGEFVAACDAGFISRFEADAARQPVEVLRQELTTKRSPVIQAGRRRLADASHRDLPPLAGPAHPT